MFGKPKGDIGFDIESYPDVFTAVFQHTTHRQRWEFEISDYKNESKELKAFANACAKDVRWVGFNNLGYDYPVIHHILTTAEPTARSIYEKSISIIKGGDRFGHIIWEPLVPQIDLYKIWHFDNMARSTSLKLLEFNMRLPAIQESTVEFDTVVGENRVAEVMDYNRWDVEATIRFYWITRGNNPAEDKIAFREELSRKYGKDFLNHNDTRVGKDFFIMKLEEAKPGSCYTYSNGRRELNQTIRESIPFNDLILDYIKFEDADFQVFLDKFRQTVVKETKGAIENVSHTHKGFQFDFGTGGIHGSVKKELVEAAEDEIIWDWDVTSYYPSLSIVNRFKPAHLGDLFCDIYEELFNERSRHDKKTSPVINLMLKLALNGVYGDSNSQYSPFFDSHLTMSITLNGQLLLCMLAEQLMKRVQMIQINTDGVTFKCKRSDMEWVQQITSNWEKLTGLSLEEARYKKMLIRDVNNYIAVYENGKVKQKGAYETVRDWHKNQSKLVVPLAVLAAVVDGADVAEFIYNHAEPLDFCLRSKISRKDKLLYGGVPQQRVTRYYVATEGEQLIKVMQPIGTPGSYKRKSKITDGYYNRVIEEIGRLPVARVEAAGETRTKTGRVKQVQARYFAEDGTEVDSTGLRHDVRIHTKSAMKHDENRETILHDKKPIQICNNLEGVKFDNINYDWYIEQANKLMKGMETDDE